MSLPGESPSPTDEAPAPADRRHRLARSLYNAALAFLLPLLLLYYAYRVTLGGKSARHLGERLGLIPRRTLRALAGEGDAPRVWVHAVSVGEVAAAHPIIRELRARNPEARIALSVTTVTGRQLAEERVKERSALFYLPLDLPTCVRAAFDSIRPDVLVIMETELWPNLLDEAHRRGIPTLLANGRVSDRSFRRARRVRFLYAWVLSCVDRLCVQTDADAERLVALGAPPDRVAVLGNSKFDESCPVVSEDECRALREEYGIALDAPLLIYGSTGPGEDGPLLDAFQAMRMALPNLRLIQDPRHPERGEEVARLARDRGFAAIRRSRVKAGEESPSGRDPVVVLDTIGELARLFAIADVVFIGRSLVPQGGGNILQPLTYGKPVLIGPHTTNFREVVRIASEAGLCFVVTTREELSEKVLALLEDLHTQQRIARDAARLLDANRGASARYAEAVSLALREESVGRG
jgi:3-deoxy-D-manno-octulosonic-acid transferase